MLFIIKKCYNKLLIIINEVKKLINNLEYNLKQKQANKFLKDYFDNDNFIKLHRKLAYEQIKHSIGNKGLIWSKLPKLLTKNTKLEKGTKYQYYNIGLQLAPSFISGYNVCPNASIDCGMTCLNFTGHGAKYMTNENNVHMVLKARIIRTLLFFEYRKEFKQRLINEILLHLNKVNQLKDTKLCIRLNVLSDIKHEKINKEIFEMFNQVIFYDYTKVLNRKVSHLKNYHLTISRNEINKDIINQFPNNKAYVFNIARNDNLPLTYENKNVIDGDLHDLRFLDKPNSIIGLRFKGNKKELENNKFVINL